MVPFASVPGAARFLTTDSGPHCMATVPRVQSFFDRPGLGAPGEPREDLAGLISNFADFLEITTRVMHGLLAYDGDVYLSIKTLGPYVSRVLLCNL
jgi:hypothetical protein